MITLSSVLVMLIIFSFQKNIQIPDMVDILRPWIRGFALPKSRFLGTHNIYPQMNKFAEHTTCYVIFWGASFFVNILRHCRILVPFRGTDFSAKRWQIRLYNIYSIYIFFSIFFFNFGLFFIFHFIFIYDISVWLTDFRSRCQKMWQHLINM